MNFNLYKVIVLVILISNLTVVCFAQSPTIKVDINMSGRTENECNDPNYLPWIPDNSVTVSKMIDDINFSFKKIGDGSALKTTYYKAGVQAPNYARLGGDAMIVDGGNSGTEVELTISGLATGTHSLMTYHNATDNPENNDFAPIDIFVNGLKVFDNIFPSERVLNIKDIQSSYITFKVIQGNDVKITYKSELSSLANNKNIYINGFELNTPNVKDQASDPFPSDGDFHVEALNASASLSWTAAQSAVKHRVYFGEDIDNVKNATEISNEYINEQTETFISVGELYSMQTYYWRIDEVSVSGAVTKGNVWSFRSRHLAFPGAEGYGRFAIGGRGGKVVHVTSLADDGSIGTLRYAVESITGPRTIVFDVGGLINLKSRLVLRDEYVTVAGQTAPGKGICIRSAPFGFTGNNVIARHMRLRLGAGETFDGMGMTGANNSILDHCSISWTIDESFSSRSGKNITLQKTLISEALNAAGHQNYPDGTEHGYAATISGEVGSFHHNLLAHNYGRNWSLGGGLDGNGYYSGKLSIVNNVVYNWGSRTTDGGAYEVDFINNYYKPGAGSKIFVALSMDHENNGPGTQRAYFNGNKMPGKWDENSQSDGRRETFSNGDSWKYECFVDKQFFPSYVTTQTADHAYKMVLSDVGATQPLFDDHDIRIINETKNGKYTYSGSITGKPGFPDHENDVGGYENYPIISRAVDWDTDKDGLPDFWEGAIGTNPNSPSGNFSDANEDADKDGYTNLEEYLNWMAEPHYFIEENSTLTIDATDFFKGFSNSPSYSSSNAIGGNVTISGSDVVFVPTDGGFGSFVLKIEDSEGDIMQRTIRAFTVGNFADQAPIVSITSPLKGTSFARDVQVSVIVSASDYDGTITKVELYNDAKKVEEKNIIPYEFSFSALSVGNHTLYAIATDNNGNINKSSEVVITILPAQSSYEGITNVVPGIVEFEHFDIGGNGFAYYDDSPGNTTSTYRDDEDVDIEDITPIGFTEKDYSIGYMTAGEWLEYTIFATDSGFYTINVIASCVNDNHSFSISVDGKDVATDIIMTNTGDWAVWDTIAITGILLDKGEQIVRITMGSENYINFDKMNFVIDVTTPVVLDIVKNGYLNIASNFIFENGLLNWGVENNSPLRIDVYSIVGEKIFSVGKKNFEGMFQLDLNSSLNKSGLYIVNIIENNSKLKSFTYTKRK